MEGGVQKFSCSVMEGGAILFSVYSPGGGGGRGCYFWPIDFAKPPLPLRPQIMNAP